MKNSLFILTIFLSSAIAACGTDKAAPGEKVDVATTTDQPAPAVETKTAAPVQTTTTTNSARDGIKLLASGGQLPVCDSAAEGETYYVVDADEFKACESNDWVVVDLRGKNGKDGSQGIAGVKGDQGDAGVNGVNGANGSNGTNGADGVSNVPSLGTYWTDPDGTHMQWVVVSKNAQLSAVSCPVGFNLPNNTEHLPAKFNNYFIEVLSQIPSNAQFWTSTVSGGRYVTTMDGVTTSIDAAAGTSSHVYICHN